MRSWVALGSLLALALIGPVGCDTPGGEDGGDDCAPPCASSDVNAIHVDKNAAAGGDGSRKKPLRSVATALERAKLGGTIKVAAGTYAEGTITIEKAVTLLGGFAGRGDFDSRDPAKYVSSLVGENTSTELKGGAVVAVAPSAAGVTIDGFTIRGGRHGVSVVERTGAVITVSHNVIEKNGLDKPDSEERGGGIYSDDNDVVILGNTIRNNTSGRGAGIACTGRGTAKIRDNVIEGNIGAGDHGGGVYLSQLGEVVHNVFRSNESTGASVDYDGGVGAGIVVIGPLPDGPPVHLSENVYTDNYAAKCGGAVFVDDGAHVDMDHELIYRNRPAAKTGFGGAGVYVDEGRSERSVLRMSFATIADNGLSGPGIGNGLYLTQGVDVVIENSIFWNNGDDGEDVFLEDPSALTFAISYSVSRSKNPNVTRGSGNIATDPLFFDAARGDYRLKSRAGRWHGTADGFEWMKDDVDSPALDAADPKSPFDLEPIPNGGRGNMGFDGNSPQASKGGLG